MIIESDFYNFALGSNKYIKEEIETKFDLTKEQLEKLYEFNSEKAVIREFKNPRSFEKKEERPF